MKLLKFKPKTEAARRAEFVRIDKLTLEGIISNVERDPLAGLGIYTKREILIDRLLAHINSCPRYVEQTNVADPIMHDTPLMLRNAVNE